VGTALKPIKAFVSLKKGEIRGSIPWVQSKPIDQGALSDTLLTASEISEVKTIHNREIARCSSRCSILIISRDPIAIRLRLGSSKYDIMLLKGRRPPRSSPTSAA
jgi:hypothetical protein